MTRSLAIVDEHGQLKLNSGGVLPIYSIAKTFIASAVCQTGIDLSAPVAQWIESDWLPHNRNITVQQLLQHSSGLRDYTGLAAYTQAIDQGHTPWQDDEYAARTLHQPLLFEPGTSFAYSNPGYWLLKRILEQVHDAPWDSIVADTITVPLSLTDTRVVHGQFAQDLPGYPAEWVWHGLMVSSAADIARFMASKLIEPLRRNTIKVSGAQPPWINPHYAFGLMVEPGRMFGHNGNGPGYSTSCFHFLEYGVTGCVLMAGATQDETMQILKDMVANA